MLDYPHPPSAVRGSRGGVVRLDLPRPELGSRGENSRARRGSLGRPPVGARRRLSGARWPDAGDRSGREVRAAAAAARRLAAVPVVMGGDLGRRLSLQAWHARRPAGACADSQPRSRSACSPAVREREPPVQSRAAAGDRAADAFRRDRPARRHVSDGPSRPRPVPGRADGLGRRGAVGRGVARGPDRRGDRRRGDDRAPWAGRRGVRPCLPPRPSSTASSRKQG